MIQYSIEGLPHFIGHDVLVLNAAVRRFDDDPDRTTAAATDRDRAAFGSILNTRFRRWAQVMGILGTVYLIENCD